MPKVCLARTERAGASVVAIEASSGSGAALMRLASVLSPST